MPESSSSSSSSNSSLNPYGYSSSGSGGSQSSSPGPVSGGGGTTLPQGNRVILDSLTKSEQINLQAVKAEHTILATRDITSARIALQTQRIDQARARSGESISGTVHKEETTLSEEQTRRLLLAAVAEICTAAQQKFVRHNRTHLQTYRYGEKWESLGRALLEQYSLDIINAGATDALPGITPEKVTAARQRQKDYVDSDTTQTDAQSNATGKRVSLKDLMKLIMDFRVETQLAAQAQWPHTDSANAAVRMKFQLPAKKKFKA